MATLQQRTFTSAALGRAMPYTVIVPPGYDPSGTTRYPALYLLHGMSGSNSEWLDFGLQEQLTALITTGAIIPMLVVLPQGDFSYWVDHVAGDKLAWGTYTAIEVVREIDSRYPTVADRQARAVGGLSMGATGAAQLALNFPGTFAIAGAHSITLRTYQQTAVDFPFFGTAAQFAQRDPILLAQSHPEVARTLDLEIDVGESDPWLPRAKVFDQTLASLGVPHLFRVWPGGHDAEYWSSHIPDDLSFYSDSFCGRPPITGKPASVPRTTLLGCRRP
jgi:enterochelin esterase-like enzyme